MTGIVGFVTKNAEFCKNKVLTSMHQEISYLDEDKVAHWKDEHLYISRVYHQSSFLSDQPAINETNSILLFFDGIIFDYKDKRQLLIDKGHTFNSLNSDAEFCLHLYEEMGDDAFQTLNGSFVIIIYNRYSKELFLISDRFSSQPLFYSINNTSFIFGTQLKALLKYPQLSLKLNIGSIMEFFTFQRIPECNTYYNEIKMIPPASIIRFANNKLSISSYWEMKYSDEYDCSEYGISQEIAGALTTALHHRTVDSSNYGLLLSGGLDARTLLAASKFPINSFILGDHHNQEVEIAIKIAKECQCRYTFLKRDTDHYYNIIDTAVEIGDGMYSFYHAHFLNFIRTIKTDCNVLLHGYGFDSIFKGSRLHLYKLQILGKTIYLPILGALNSNDLVKSLLVNPNDHLWHNSIVSLFSKDIQKRYSNHIIACIEHILHNSQKCTQNIYNQYEYFFINNPCKLPAYLNCLCMRHFINERTIAFDNNLFDIYLKMPVKSKFHAKAFKRALKILNPRLAKIPDANTGLSPMLPFSIEWSALFAKKIYSKFFKQSYSDNPILTYYSWPNMAELIRYNKNLKNIIDTVINDKQSIDSRIFNRIEVKRLFKKHIEREGDYTELLFLLLTFGKWYRRYGNL